MYFYIHGNVVFKATNFIALLANDICYQIFTPYSSYFSINEKYLIYTYQVIREDGQYLVGFKSIEDRNMFLSLIEVNGVGPKTALNILKGASCSDLKEAINNGNVSFLKKLTGVGNKVASQIILDLKGKLVSIDNFTDELKEIKKALLNLGFNNKEISDVLSNLNTKNKSKGALLKEALNKLRK